MIERIELGGGWHFANGADLWWFLRDPKGYTPPTQWTEKHAREFAAAIHPEPSVAGVDLAAKLRKVNGETAPYANPEVLRLCHAAADALDARPQPSADAGEEPWAANVRLNAEISKLRAEIERLKATQVPSADAVKLVETYAQALIELYEPMIQHDAERLRRIGDRCDAAHAALLNHIAGRKAEGLEPPGCPIPGACACPGGEAELAKRLAAMTERVRVLEEALRDVCDPLSYLRRKAEAKGGQLNHMAYGIANNLHFVQGIARTALNPTGDA